MNPALYVAALFVAALSPAAVAAPHPGDQLRARLGIALPRSSELIIVYGVADHLRKSEWSIVAWTDGRVWTVERVGRESAGVVPIAPRAFPPIRRVMLQRDTVQLRQLLRNPALFTEQAQHDAPEIGGFASTMEIITPGRQRAIKWTGRLGGTLGKVADLVIGPG